MDDIQKANKTIEAVENLAIRIQGDPILYFSLLSIFTGVFLLIQYKWRQKVNKWYEGKGMSYYRQLTIIGGVVLISIGFILLILKMLLALG